MTQYEAVSAQRCGPWVSGPKAFGTMYRLAFYILFSFISPAVFSTSQATQKTFDFNENCRLAYREIIQLKLTAGQQFLDQEKKAHPENLVPFFLENYIDFFVLFFNEDPAEYAARVGNEEKRLELMNQGPESSPFFLFCKSVIHFQWAAVKIKTGHNIDAAFEFRRSFLQGKENQKKFPAFTPNAMLNGAMQVAAGTIPDGYKWLSSLLGIRGTVKYGMAQLKTFLGEKDTWARLYWEEAVFYYLYLEFYIGNKKEEVFDFLEKNKLDVVNNHLFAYLAANLGVNGQRSEFAKTVLVERNNASGYLDMPVWDLEMGYVKLNHLEPDADVYLNRFIERFRGKLYVKDVLQKLSWFYYLQDDQRKADTYRRYILEKGNTETEADKQAEKEAGGSKWPAKTLLRARLLNDGGYHEEALQAMVEKKPSDFPEAEDKLEYSYRLARIYDDLGKNDLATAEYLVVIKTGSGSREYFAARAALQMGYMYEKQGNKATACVYFQKCIDMKDHDYKNSLDQKAKAGIARCKNE